MSDSETDTASHGTSSIQDILQQEPMYYVLKEFLQTPEQKNIAELLQELVTSVNQLRIQLQSVSQVTVPSST